MTQTGRKSKEKIKNNSSDYPLFIITILLVLFGIIMLLSASAPASLAEYGNSYKYLTKQSIAIAAGLFLMFFLSMFDYRIYKKFKWPIYAAVVILQLLVIPLGVSENGASRWISLGGFNFQPSECAKLGLVIFYAATLSEIKENGKLKNYKYGFLIPLLPLAFVLAIIYKVQNHASVCLLLAAVTCIQMFVVGVPIIFFLIAAAIVGILGLGGYTIFKAFKPTVAGAESGGFRLKRIKVWLDPFSDPKGAGWQTIQSYFAIASGGLFGLGLGQSKQKYLYLPEPQNDFIFSVLAEELGFVGCIVVIILFALFIWRGIVIAMRAPDTFSSLIAIGIVSTIGLQAIINIAVVTGAIPVTGMPLPFFSYGGTAILINLASVGVLLNISKSCNTK